MPGEPHGWWVSGGVVGVGSCGSRAPRCGPGVQSKISTWQGALARAGTPGHRWLLVRGAPAPAATGQGAPGRGHSALAGGRLCSSVHWPSPAGPSGSLSHTPRPGCCSSGLGGLGSGPECGRVCAHPHSGDTEGCGCSKGGVGEALPLASRAGCPLPAASPAASPQQGQAAGTGPAPVPQLHGASGETPPPRPHVLRTLWPDFLSPVLEVPLAQVLSVPSRCGVPRTRHSLPPAVQSLIHPLVELQLWASRRDGTEDAAEDETRVAPAPVAGRLPGGPRDNGQENKTLWGRPLCRANSGVSEAKAEGRWWGHLHTGRSRRPTPGVGVSAEGRAGAGRGARVAGAHTEAPSSVLQAGCGGAGGEARCDPRASWDRPGRSVHLLHFLRGAR